MNISITKLFEFEAAHCLPKHEGKCKNLHGHRYQLEVEVGREKLDELILDGPSEGMVMDFGDLKRIVQNEVIEKLDHRDLNEVFESLEIDKQATAENLILWIVRILKESFAKRGIYLVRVRLWETSTSFAEWWA